jgi:hypothetical protein
LFISIAAQYRDRTLSMSQVLNQALHLSSKILGWMILITLCKLVARLLHKGIGVVWPNDAHPILNFLSSTSLVIVYFTFILLTFFVVPIFIYETISIRESIKRSVQVFRKRWIELLFGEFFLILIASLPVAIFYILIKAIGNISIVQIVFDIAAMECGFLIMQSVFITALYIESIEGTVPIAVPVGSLDETLTIEDMSSVSSPSDLRLSKVSKMQCAFSWSVAMFYFIEIVVLTKTTPVFFGLYKDFHAQLPQPVAMLIWFSTSWAAVSGLIFGCLVIGKDYLVSKTAAVRINIISLFFLSVFVMTWMLLLIQPILKYHKD